MKMSQFQTELMVGHMDLVVHIARHMHERVLGVTIDEFKSAGNVGLMVAAKKYCAMRGIPFDQYAKHRIRGAMLDHLRALDYANRCAREKSNHIKKAERTLEHELGRTPTEEEIALELGWGIGQLRQANCLLRSAMLVRGPMNTATAAIASPDLIAVMDRKAQYEQVIAASLTLRANQRKVIDMLFVRQCTQREVAVELRITEGRVSQLKSQALVNLRNKLVHAATA